jgi:hypothetical protein
MNLVTSTMLFILTIVWQHCDMGFNRDTRMIMSAVFFVGALLSLQIWSKK